MIYNAELCDSVTRRSGTCNLPNALNLLGVGLRINQHQGQMITIENESHTVRSGGPGSSCFYGRNDK